MIDRRQRESKLSHTNRSNNLAYVPMSLKFRDFVIPKRYSTYTSQLSSLLCELLKSYKFLLSHSEKVGSSETRNGNETFPWCYRERSLMAFHVVASWMLMVTMKCCSSYKLSSYRVGRLRQVKKNMHERFSVAEWCPRGILKQKKWFP